MISEVSYDVITFFIPQNYGQKTFRLSQDISDRLKSVSRIAYSANASTQGLSAKISIGGVEIISENTEVEALQRTNSLSLSHVQFPIEKQENVGGKKIEIEAKFDSDTNPAVKVNLYLLRDKL